MNLELTKLHSETSPKWSHTRSWTVLRYFPISFNAWQQRSNAVLCFAVFIRALIHRH